MSKSNHLRLREIRQVHDLINRISEFGDRPEIWERIALEGLLKILGGNVGFTLDTPLLPDGSPQLIDPIDTGWHTDSARQRFIQYAASSGEMAADPGTIAVLQAQQKNRFISNTRRELVDDATWYASPCVSEARHMSDVDDFVIISSATQCRRQPWPDHLSPLERHSLPTPPQPHHASSASNFSAPSAKAKAPSPSSENFPRSPL